MGNNKIMIVDDDATTLQELSELLGLSGYKAVIVTDTDKVLDTALKSKPSLILMDLKMPKKTGIQMAHELKNHPDTGGVPIIAMSAFFNEGKMSIPAQCGIKKCLRKPFNPTDVIKEIEQVLTHA